VLYLDDKERALGSDVTSVWLNTAKGQDCLARLQELIAVTQPIIQSLLEPQITAEDSEPEE
jgi:hypothetical protein